MKSLLLRFSWLMSVSPASGEWGMGSSFAHSPFPTPHSLLFSSGFDILQRVFSLLNSLFGFAADVLVNFERRRQIGFELPQAFFLGLDGAITRLVLHPHLLHQPLAVEGWGVRCLSQQCFASHCLLQHLLIGIERGETVAHRLQFSLVIIYPHIDARHPQHLHLRLPPDVQRAK